MTIEDGSSKHHSIFKPIHDTNSIVIGTLNEMSSSEVSISSKTSSNSKSAV